MELPENAITREDGSVWVNDQPVGFVFEGDFYPVKGTRKSTYKKIQREVVSQKLADMPASGKPILITKERVINPNTSEDYHAYQIRRLRQEVDENGKPLPAFMYRKRDMSPAETIEIGGEVYGYAAGGFNLKGDEEFAAFMRTGQSVFDKQ